MAEVKTREEIEQLKADWIDDPEWDIEHTEGFQAHTEELKAFSDEMNAEWERARVKRLEDRAEALGCPGNLELAQYVDVLEYRIEQIQDRIEALYE